MRSRLSSCAKSASSWHSSSSCFSLTKPITKNKTRDCGTFNVRDWSSRGNAQKRWVPRSMQICSAWEDPMFRSVSCGRTKSYSVVKQRRLCSLTLVDCTIYRPTIITCCYYNVLRAKWWDCLPVHGAPPHWRVCRHLSRCPFCMWKGALIAWVSCAPWPRLPGADSTLAPPGNPIKNLDLCRIHSNILSMSRKGCRSEKLSTKISSRQPERKQKRDKERYNFHLI